MMSRPWDDPSRKYLNAENLWGKIDELSQQIDQQAEDAPGNSSESYKMFLMGRREMLQRIIDYLYEHEQPLSEIAKIWGLKDK
jgi:hypothetical protein